MESGQNFQYSSTSRSKKDLMLSWVFRFLTYTILFCAIYIFFDITVKGLPALLDNGIVKTFTNDPETLVVYEDADGVKHKKGFVEFTDYKKGNQEAVIRNEHTHSYSAGGIRGPLIGTILLIFICIVVAMVIGIATAIYLSEYSKKGRLIAIIRLAILNLAGVPSIVFGLFGLMFFCLFVPVITKVPADRSVFEISLMFDYYLSFQGWGPGMLAGGFTLAVMILPVIITASEESLKAVPRGFREASLALGATHWQTIRTSVLPYAFPGILTASILGITRVAGETAPIMFTAAIAHKDKLPWQNLDPNDKYNFLQETGLFLSEQVQAMPYHIYTISAKIPQSEYTKPMQYVSVFIFMLLVICLAALSIWLRSKLRRQLKW